MVETDVDTETVWRERRLGRDQRASEQPDDGSATIDGDAARRIAQWNRIRA